MNKIGVHNLVFVTDWSEASARKAIGAAAEIGFDHIEVVIFDPFTTNADITATLAQSAGIEVAAGMALNIAADLSSPNPEIAAKGERLVADCIQVTRDMGAPALGGVEEPSRGGPHLRYEEGPRDGAEPVERVEDGARGRQDEERHRRRRGRDLGGDERPPRAELLAQRSAHRAGGEGQRRRDDVHGGQRLGAEVGQKQGVPDGLQDRVTDHDQQQAAEDRDDRAELARANVEPPSDSVEHLRHARPP